jgi:hypothetical protein
MSTPAADRGIRIGIITVLVIGAAGLGLTAWMSRASSARLIHDYVPDSGVSRFHTAADAVEEATMINDFDVSDGEMFVLDAGGPQVIVLHQVGGHWKAVRSFGRRGGGPGELLAPSGIAVLPATRRIVVVDQDRLHYFNATGEYLETRVPVLPCHLGMPRVASAGTGVLLTGRCIHADTMMAELFYVPAVGDTASLIASDPIYAIDGSAGSVLSANSFYADGADHGLFGSGTGDCIYRVRGVAAADGAQPNGSAVPTAVRDCAVGNEHYAFTVDPEFREKAKALAAAKPWAAATFAIPTELPLYMAPAVAGASDLVIRPVTNDSVAFRAIGSDQDLLIMPAQGLIGCRAAGCLWSGSDMIQTITFVPARTLSALAGAGPTAADRIDR